MRYPNLRKAPANSLVVVRKLLKLFDLLPGLKLGKLIETKLAVSKMILEGVSCSCQSAECLALLYPVA